MKNKTAALEWLRIAYHDLKSAEILYDAKHYTDSIGNDLQQALEKLFKALMAAKNEKIPKTHDLLEIYESIEDFEIDESDLLYLALATEYFKEERYPNPSYSLPKREEIAQVLAFTQQIFTTICNKLQIDINQIKG